MNKKVCLKGNDEKAEEIIKYLESLGGHNKNDYYGHVNYMYYFINKTPGN